ncbi:hypothetical protein EZI54_09450 [Marinobacter halodurans]|uniref:Uncharacterized protein n=1 Tax=Marinobacter halodurans TaxID=2528979 RepID=A0ABY1ZLQ5_9GAMM|nr:hypothetical protein [Marinobacter halodurans]TBW56512.1 hypothetical protein EZI54_09450 [Marinobacter halodurans]
MQYPKLSPWPFIDPESPPNGYSKVGESFDKDRATETIKPLWHFFAHGKHLIIVKKIWLKGRNGKPGKYATTQFEYPMAGARWFVDTIERFFLHPDHPNAIPRGKFNVREEVDGETLGVTRGAAYGGRDIPGYTFDNLNRIEHSTIMEGPFCQMFEMGDPWLFEDGLFDLFKDIAERHERGEF